MTETRYGQEYPETSFVTCVSDWRMYERCVVASFERIHSSGAILERVPIDNVGNRFSASQALNIGLKHAKGKLIVFCHQDIIFPPGWLSGFFLRIKELEGQTTSWGVIGLAGRCADGSKSGHIVDPHGEFLHLPLPQRVQTLDELCLVIRKDSGLRFDEYFDHYHLYGADLCLTAACRGLPCFTVDCCLEHLSGGNKGQGWRQEKEKLIKKWWPKRQVVGKKICTTSGTIRLHSPLVRLIRHMNMFRDNR